MNAYDNSGCLSSLDTIIMFEKKPVIHERMIRIIEKKIKYNVELDNHDLEYIQTDCDEKDKQGLIQNTSPERKALGPLK